MNVEWTQVQQMFKKNASDFAKSVLEPIACDDDKREEFPADAVKKMADFGFLGMTVPKEFEGTDVDLTSVALVIEEFGKMNASAAAIATTHIVLAAQTIAKYGSDAQKKQWLPKMAKGEVLGGHALAEPGAGLASGPDKVTAVKDGDGYVLKGKKSFVANGGKAGVYVVYAQTDEEAGPKGMSAFLVDGAGIKATPVGKLGVQALPTAVLDLDGVKAELLGTENEGSKIIVETLARADIVNAAMATGIASAMLDDSSAYCKIRVQFGAPIGKIQAVQWLLAEIGANVHTMRAMVYQSTACYDKKGDYILDSAYTKMYCMKAGVEAGMNAVQIHGGTGYSREAKIERYFRDVRGAFILENINDYPQKTIASALLK